MDSVYGEANRFSIGKAVISAGTGLPSAEVEGIVDHPPTACVVAQGVPAIRVRGGLPIFRKIAKSRAPAESAERRPTNKRRSVLALGLPASAVKKQAEASRPRTWGARNRSSKPLWLHGTMVSCTLLSSRMVRCKLCTGRRRVFDQSQGKTVR